MTQENRPKVAAEVRAWAVVAVTMLVQIIGGVWWAATLNAEVKALRELVSELRTQIGSSYSANDAARDLAGVRRTIDDHEGRLRHLERKP